MTVTEAFEVIKQFGSRRDIEIGAYLAAGSRRADIAARARQVLTTAPQSAYALSA